MPKGKVSTPELSNVLVPVQQTTPATLLEIAIKNNADIDKLQKLMEMQIAWDNNEARKAYHRSMAMFKADPPKIVKDRLVNYSTKAGGTTRFMHASLNEVADKIGEQLSKYGLSASWNTTQREDGQITVTCTITHEMGYSESTSLTAAPDDSGGKNRIQAVGSTVTYLERYTLLAKTGLATADMDDDGNQGKEEEIILLSEQQIVRVEGLCKKINKGVDRLLTYINNPDIDSIQKIPASKFNDIVKTLETIVAKEAKSEVGDDNNK